MKIKLSCFLLLSAAITASADVSSADYVQDGLVAHWDAIDNAGRGVHDSNATNWVNLVDGGMDLIVDKGVWGASELYCDGVLAAHGTGTLDYATLEIAFVNASTGANAWLFSNGISKYCALATGRVQWCNNRGITTFSFSNAGRHTLSWVNDKAAYIDGASTPYGNYNDTWNVGPNYVHLGLRTSDNKWPFGGKYYSIRAYNRELTAEEIAVNAVVDTTRFGNPRAKPDMVVDGNMWYWATTLNWSNDTNWRYGTYACNGGVATIEQFASGNGATLNQNVSGLTLRGIDFMGLNGPRIGGDAITMVNDPFVTGSSSAKIGVSLNTAEGETLRKRGRGTITFEKPVSGSLAAVDGTTATTNTGATAQLAQSLKFNGGVVKPAPTAQADESVSVKLADSAVIGYGTGELNPVKNGAAVSVTLADSLTRENGGTLSITAPSGTAELGETERVLVGTPPALQNGIVAPYIVSRDAATDIFKYGFLSYDAEKGFVPFTGYTEGLDGGATSVALVKTNYTLAADAHVHALRVDDRALVSIPSGVTLTIGDGVNPAGLIFNSTTINSNTYEAWTNDGAVDFGSSQGVIWKASPANGNGRGINIRTKIKGSNGMVFTARPGANNTFYCFFNGYCDWTGPTYFDGCRAWMNGANTLPPGGDVYLAGGRRDRSVQFSLATTETFTQHFFVSGYGLQVNNDGSGVFYNGNGHLATLAGPVTLLDDSQFLIAANQGKTSGIKFDNAIDGKGDLDLTSAGNIFFNGTNTYLGSTAVRSSVNLHLGPKGTFGQGDVNFTSSGTLKFDGNDRTFTNTISQTAGSTLLANAASPTFLGVTKLNKLTMETNTTIGVGESMTIAGNVDASVGASLRAAAPGATLSFDSSSDISTVVSLEDGEGLPLAVEKNGTGTLVLHGSQSFTGGLTVNHGTVKFTSGILNAPDIVWWFDANDDATISVNDDGEVTNWVSKVGNVKLNNKRDVSYTAWPRRITAANGMKMLSFDRANQRVICGKNLSIRHGTVIIAHVNDSGNPYMAGIFGGAATDIGMRTTGSNAWRTDWTGATYATDGLVWMNGVKAGAFSVGATYVLSMQHASDAKATCVFNPCFGGYSTLSPSLAQDQSNNRCWNGAIGEAIAFSRVITDDERKAVEQYLSEKWRGATIYTDFSEPAVAPLAAGTPVTILSSGTLDLNGHSVSVASLAGAGAIVNSGATNATLTVTGPSSFSGTVGAGVTLAAGGPGVTLDDPLPGPPRDGLLYWLDASKADTVHLNNSGVVTNLASRAGNGPKNFFAPSSPTDANAPTYDSDGSAGFGAGKPALHFNTGAYLKADARCESVTVFIVLKKDGSQSFTWGIFGSNQGSDIGFRYANNTGVNLGTGSGYTRVGDYVRFNRVQQTGQTGTFSGETLVLAAVLGIEWHSATRYGYNAINKYGGNSGAKEWFAEIIAYSRKLSEAEVAAVEDYLFAKWIDSSAVPAEDATLLDGGSVGIHVTVNPDGTFTPAYLDAPVDLSQATFTVDGLDFLPRNVSHTMFSISDRVTGNLNLSACDFPKSWRVWRVGDSWKMLYNMGTVIIFK